MTQSDSRSTVIIAAIDKEAAALLAALDVVACDSMPFPTWLAEGRVGDIIVIVSGLGKANAAAATAAAIERYSPNLIVNVGCAGAFAGSGLTVGDIAVATEEIAADEGVLTLEGWLPLNEFGFPVAVVDGVRYFNAIPLSQNLVGKAVESATGAEFNALAGSFVTVSTCSGTAARGDELWRRHAPLCENMEGAAVAQVALRYGIECVEIRGVSNMVEDRDLSRWNLGLAVGRAQQAVLAFLQIIGVA